MDKALLILAGGASSRMKKSLGQIDLPTAVADIAAQQHKSLIPLGLDKKPLLVRLIENAVAAGYDKIYIVTAPNNSAFQQTLEPYADRFKGVAIDYAIQQSPAGQDKPLGTADAVAKALNQYTDLLAGEFTLCNGDNLYSVNSLQQLLAHRETPHAMIAYARSCLTFSEDRIARFALLEMDKKNYLTRIIEKPNADQMAAQQKEGEETFVSMNLFRFTGKLLLPYLEQCPLHPERNEKELPVAVEHMVQDNPGELLCYQMQENIADLTSAEDINLF